MAKVAVEQRGPVTWIWLDRPDVRNAFDDEVVRLLHEAIERASSDETTRAIVIGGRGKAFSAGADLGWMQRAGELTEEDNQRDALNLAGMLRALANSPKATIARVQGAALGGGLGLIAACDLSVAVARAKFGFSEVKLGLIPAVISPHVIERLGPARARGLFVTGERFDANRAERLGLIGEVVEDEAALDAAVEALLEQILANAPGAVADAKALVEGVLARQAPAELDAYTAGEIARRRACPEGQEGIAAFLAKRPPKWAGGGAG